MKKLGNSYCRYVYVYEFPNFNCVYVGLTWDIEDRHKRHQKSGSVFEFIIENNIILDKPKIIGYYTKEEASEKEVEIERIYSNKEWTTLNRMKPGGLGGSRRKWTKDKCKEIAIMCESRMDFKKLNKSAYQISANNKWLDEICSHMIPKSKPKGYWTKERCKESATNYKNKVDFRKSEPSPYTISSRNEWLDDFFKK
jgi:predicted GIY-YIG superfamily endonuclease